MCARIVPIFRGGRRQEAEGRRQKAEGRRQKAATVVAWQG